MDHVRILDHGRHTIVAIQACDAKGGASIMSCVGRKSEHGFLFVVR